METCDYFANMINYLGHIIRVGRPGVANHTTDGIRELNTPTIQTVLHSFFGLCNVFYRFVLNFARIASPLPARLRKSPAKDLGQQRRADRFEYITGETYISPNTSFTTRKRTIHP